MRLCLILVFVLYAAGCSTLDSKSRREISLLRAEILDLEDQYYSLKSKYQQTATDLADCRGEPVPDDALMFDEYYSEGEIIFDDACDDCGQVHPPGYTHEVYSLDPAINSPIGTGVEPMAQPFNETGSDRETIQGEPIDSNQGAGNYRQGFPLDNSADLVSDSHLWRKSSVQLQRQNDRSFSQQDDRFIDGESFVQVQNSRIEQLLIEPELTYAKDFDGDGFDDGIAVLLQPLDSNGEIVPRAGDLVVSVIDPRETGESQRVGLWKFQSYQVESFVSTQRGSRGLVMELPWQRRSPANSKLIVFVRYITPDGRTLESSLDLNVRPDKANGSGPLSNEPIGQPTNTAGAGFPQWRPVR